MSRPFSLRGMRLRLARPGRSALRLLLLTTIPVLALLVAVYFYVLGGRFVSTENAYIKADTVEITAQVDGPITRVAVAENEPVVRGALLFEIDPTPYRIALRRAQARLQQARSEIETLKASYREAQEALKLARLNADYTEREYQRQLQLARRNLTSQSQLDRYRHERDVAREQGAALQQKLARIQASLDGDPTMPVRQHSRYLEAEAACNAATLDLQRTQVHAPFAGVAAKVPDQGTYVTVGKPAMSIIADQGVWVVANFKETEITHMKPGQSVSIEVDTYPGHKWYGRVESIAQATGSEFSLLPPQNASGNWVKVVQRIPVRIALDDQPGDPPLRAGMSVSAVVDTGYHRRGPGLLAPLVSWAREAIAPVQAHTGS